MERLTSEHLANLQQVSERALTVITNEFGTGYPHYRGGKNGGLAYHNRIHSEFVAEGSARMAIALDLARSDIVVARPAGAAHDIIQRGPRGVMEKESAVWLDRELVKRKLPDTVRSAAVLAILGTEPTFQGKRIVGQRMTQQKYPTKLAELIAASVASADLGGLYEAMGPYHAHRLWQEIKGQPASGAFPLEGIIQFHEGQRDLAASYRFPHPKGEKVFGKLRGPVIEYWNRLIADMQAGLVMSSEQIWVRDLAFARRHS